MDRMDRMDLVDRPRRVRLAALWLASALPLLLALAALPGAAQEARKYDFADTVTVSALDVEQRILTAETDGGETMRFVVDDKTEIKEGGEVLALGDLSAGDRVTVNARQPVPDVEGHPPIAEVVLVVTEEASTE